ncbi:MAG: hypothetical protein STSR0009_05790 [Methanoregula sp.]
MVCMKVMVDSNILIFSNIGNIPEYSQARKKLLKLINDDYTFATNAIIISEVNYKLQKMLSGDEAYRRTNNLLHSTHFEYFPIDQTTIEGAIELNLTYHMRIIDALIAQHCLDLQLDGIFTDNVKDFREIPDLDIIALREDTK